jgi:hypothetical protein
VWVVEWRRTPMPALGIGAQAVVATVMQVLGITAQAMVATALRAVAMVMHTAQAPFISRFAGMSRASWGPSY